MYTQRKTLKGTIENDSSPDQVTVLCMENFFLYFKIFCNVTRLFFPIKKLPIKNQIIRKA